MAVKLVQRILRLWAVVLAPILLSGCRVFVQNRYAVFGFDSLQTESVEHARVWSLGLLGGIVVISATLGAIGLWLAPRLYRGWREGLAAPASGREQSGDADR